MKTTTAALVFVCFATACAVLSLTALHAPLTAQGARLCLGAGLVTAGAFWLSAPPSAPLRMRWPDWAAAILMAIVSVRAFCWLVFTNGNDICVLSPNNLGDLSLHLTYIRSIAKGAPFWPENPIYSGLPLHYPAGMDIFNALFSVFGCDDFRTLVWIGLAASALTAVALLRWGGWFALLGFLCNGGLAGWSFFHRWSFHIADYQDAVAWKNIFLSMFVTQRGLLYAIPAGLLLMSAWRVEWFGDPGAKPLLPLWVQVALYATMPLFHVHTFLFLSALLGYWLILGRPGAPLRRQAADLLLWSILPATLCVSVVTGLFQKGASPGGMIHLTPGWMQDGQPFFQFWLGNFGLLPLLALAVAACGLSRCRRDPLARDALAFVIPCIGLFLIGCIVMFAPWEWDNMKLLIWCYLGLLPFLHEALERLPQPWGSPARFVCVVFLFFSGFISLLGGLDSSHTGYEITHRSELDAVRDATRAIPATETFAGFPTYNHPLLLAGCKMAEGYAGHLVSYAIPYQQRLDRLNALMQGEPGWRDIARSLRIRYLYWGPAEEANYVGSAQPWLTLPTVASGPWGTIYDLGKPR